MAFNRIGRINEEIQRELADLLRTLKDPRVQATMISVTRVETTPDLRYAKVFVSFLEKSKAAEELQWQEDDSITRGAHMLDLLNSLHSAKDDEDDLSDPT